MFHSAYFFVIWRAYCNFPLLVDDRIQQETFSVRILTSENRLTELPVSSEIAI